MQKRKGRKKKKQGKTGVTMGSNLSARVKVSVRLFNPLIIELFFIIISTKSRKREKGPYARLRADPSMQPSSRRKLWLRGPVDGPGSHSCSPTHIAPTKTTGLYEECHANRRTLHATQLSFEELMIRETSTFFFFFLI